MIVIVVVTEDSTVVHTAYKMIDVCQIVLDDDAFAVLPYFFPQLCATTGPTQYDFFVNDLR